MRKIIKKIDSLLSSQPLLQQLVKGSFAPLVAKVAGMLAVYAFIWIISNEFGATIRGEFAIFFAMLGILAVICNMGMDTSLVKYIAAYKVSNSFGKIKSVYKTGISLSLLSSTIASVTIFIFRNDLDQIFLEPTNRLHSPFLYLSISLPLFTLLILNAETLRGLEKMSLYSLLQNGSIFLLTIPLMFLFITYKKGSITTIPAEAFVFSLGTLTLISFFLFFYHTRNQSKIESFGSINSLLKVSLPMMLSNSVFFLMSWSDILMIGYFLPEDQTGIYSNASKVANLNIVFLFAINAIAAPKMAAFKEKKDSSSLKSFTKITSKMNILLSAPVFLIILLFPDFLLGLFGSEFLPGKTALLILAVGQFSNAAAGSVINVLNMTGKQVLAQNIILITALINLVLNAILIPKFGINGAAIATASSTIIWNMLAVLFIYKSYRFISVTLPWQKI